MKISIAIAAVFLGMASLLYAAIVPLANGPSVLTSAQINGAVPGYAGQPVICSNCGDANAGKYNFCISTGTGIGAFILISSAATSLQCK